MAWEHRRGRRYYYRTHRVNGRVVKEYVGTGEVAEMAARLDAEAAANRALVRAERLRTRAELEELDTLLEQIDREVNEFVSVAMTVAGFHRHRGEWRRKRTVATPDTPQPAPAPVPAGAAPPTFDDLYARARTGDHNAMLLLRPLLDDPTTVEEFGGNVARRSLNTAVWKMTGKDLVTREATARKLEQLRAELAGPNPTLLEQMLVDRVVATWFQLHRLEREFALAGDDPKQIDDYQRSLTSSQNRYFTAIRELNRVRQAQQPPPVQVNIAHEQVNVVNVPKG
jgi:hypothetical protein